MYAATSKTSPFSPLPRFFLTSLLHSTPSISQPRSPRRTVFYNRAFRVQCYLYHPRVHSACSVAIATNDKLSHENAPLSLHVYSLRLFSLSRFLRLSFSIRGASLSPSLNRYGRRLITRAYTRIRLYVRRPMKYSRHGNATMVLLALLAWFAPVRYKSRGPWWKRKADWNWETGSPTDIIRACSSVNLRSELWSFHRGPLNPD